MRVGNSRENFFHATRYFSSEKEVCKTRKKNVTTQSLDVPRQSVYKICGECENEDKLVPLVLSRSLELLCNVDCNVDSTGLPPHAPLRGRARVTSGASRRIPGRYALSVGNISPARSHRTAPSSPFTSGWFFMRPLTCSLVPWEILRWTFRGALDVARARTCSSPPSRSDFAVSASISARAARASLPTRASLAGRSSPSHDTPSRTTRGT